MNKLCRLISGVSLLFLSVVLHADAEPSEQHLADNNRQLTEQAFANWANGRGSVFDLLSEQAEWTVAGISPVSGTYATRQALLSRAVEPIHARLSTPITPVVKSIVAEGDQVVVFWDGRAEARDGSLYRNSYAWHLVFSDGEIINVTAFLDTWALVELME